MTAAPSVAADLREAIAALECDAAPQARIAAALIFLRPALTAQLKRDTALRWYATENNYNEHGAPGRPEAPGIPDFGETARAALAGEAASGVSVAATEELQAIYELLGIPPGLAEYGVALSAVRQLVSGAGSDTVPS